MKRKKKHRKQSSVFSPLLVALIAIIIVASLVGAFYFLSRGSTPSGSQTISTESSSNSPPIILYINQGNGAVNESNFDSMLSFASSRGFNMIFFQIYRSGNLLFSNSELSYFITQSHSKNLQIFFALYFTASNQTIPNTIYTLGEDGISLDMSTLDSTTQANLLSTLQSNFHGRSAVTTFDFQTTLKPDLLIFETYGTQDQQYIHHGIIASVGVFTTSSEQDYNSQFSYALRNSDGVMVFDYATLLSRGY